MESEMNNFIMVWSSVLMSACYCYVIPKMVPKGTIRFLMFFPVLCLFVHLPLYLNSVNLILPTAFSVTWLSIFKILLLVFGTGPLSNPSLSLYRFVLIFCLPIKLQRPTKSHPGNVKNNPNKIRNKENLDNPPLDRKSDKIGLRSTFTKVSIMICVAYLGYNKHMLPRDIFLFLSCFFACIGLELGLEGAAVMGRLLLGSHVEPPFDKPYLSTSFQDFWGRRWNRVASSSLRTTIFDPTLSYASRSLGRKWATILAVLVTFVISDLMHEIIFYYLGRVRPGWGTLLFFLVQGLCVVIESTLKKKFDFRWPMGPIIIGPLIYSFMLCTFMWLAFEELMVHNVVDRALEEYAAVGTLVKNMGLAWVEKSG